MSRFLEKIESKSVLIFNSEREGSIYTTEVAIREDLEFNLFTHMLKEG